MVNLLTPEIQLLIEDPDLKAFVYQQIADFEAFITPETTIYVVHRDPKKLAIQLETEGKSMSPNELQNMSRVAIVLKEGDTKIEAEGLHEDIYQAISIAKELLMNQLVAIQDSVISSQDRQEQINFALSNTQLH